MSTRFVKFPPANETDANAYNDECTAQFVAASGGTETVWAIVRLDRNNNWTVPLYGPPFQYGGVEVEEPASCAALRETGVVVETPEWPLSGED